MKTEKIIMTRRPALSGNARKYSRGYLKIALVEVDRDELARLGQSEPKMISERSRGVVRVVECGQLYYGEGVRSEGARFLAKLKKQTK
jgi:hypothetical protein